MKPTSEKVRELADNETFANLVKDIEQAKTGKEAEACANQAGAYLLGYFSKLYWGRSLHRK